MQLSDVLAFTQLTHAFQRVERVAHVTGTDRLENDLEHSGQLALMAWHLADSYHLSLDRQKLLQYALAHDLVEVYAGDTFFYLQDLHAQEQKRQAEERAAQQLQERFPNHAELHAVIHRYEDRADAEACFIYALDKILPVLNIFLDGGRTWRDHTISLAMIRTKREKVALYPDLLPLWDELVTQLEAGQKHLFP